jgi:Holliday junction resolvase
MDTKYLFESSKLPDLLEQLKQHYYVLEIKKNRVSRYKTLYFDTEDFKCYYIHQFGRKNRYKVRIRRYLESNKTFLEVKYKNNHGKTKKTRIGVDDNVFEIKKEHLPFINEKTKTENLVLKDALWVNYSRISLVSKNFTERLTIDAKLTFEMGDKTSNYENIIILELKQDKRNFSQAQSILQDMKIFKSSCSKYCLGVASIHPVKKNNIKEKIRLINRMSYEGV